MPLHVIIEPLASRFDKQTEKVYRLADSGGIKTRMLGQQDQVDSIRGNMEDQVETTHDKNEANIAKDESAFGRLCADIELNFKPTSDTLTVRMIIFTGVTATIEAY